MLWFYESVAAYLERVLAQEATVLQSFCDPLQDPLLCQDQLDLTFICGLPFSRYQQRVPNQLQAIAAPVMAAARYQGRPIYFSDVIVAASSNLNSFADLAGKTFCYNDSGSNSGYHLINFRNRQAGYPVNFFGNSLCSGCHQASIRWVIDGRTDCAAIDSTVLEQELGDFPELVSKLRVVESIGPCAIPPIAASQRLGANLIGQIQLALLKPDAAMKATMTKARIRRFAVVKSDEYTAMATFYNGTP